jgi:hypothetical protein
MFVNAGVSGAAASLATAKKSLVRGTLRHPAVLNSPLPVANFYFAAR